MRKDLDVLEAPPTSEGIRLLPPGDPYLQKPNRLLLAPYPELRKRVFRPLASPGAVLMDGRLAGLWRVKTSGKKAELTIEALEPLWRAELEEEARRVTAPRGAADVAIVLA